MRIYERVKRYINDQGIKHAVIAKKAGIPAKTFSAIMCGRRPMYAEDLESICNVLGVNAGAFFTENDQSA